jgi:glycosyltransferase involved in cell wall biosynthesis
MPPLRIAKLMASGPVVGGLEKHFVDLCGALAAEYKVLALADPIHASSLPSEVEFCPIDFSVSRRNPVMLMRIFRLLKAFRPDIIHAHANKSASIVDTLRYFSKAKRVATVHGLKSNNQVFRRFDAVICVSSAIRERVKLPQATVIHNGIQPLEVPVYDSTYFVRQLGITQKRPIVITVGRLAAVKGYAGLIESWRGVNADLVIVGDGPERAALAALVDQWNLCESVHLVGFRRDVPKLMFHADLVVISSEREGFPYAMVEALQLGKVIVSTRFPGAEDYLPERFLVQYGEVQLLRQRIRETLSRLNDAKSEYQATWQRARTELTVENMVRQTKRIYVDVLCRS